MGQKKKDTKKLTYFAILIALVLVLQSISALLSHFGVFSISLVLVPIVVGGMLLGAGYGAALGFTFGLLTIIYAIVGLDAGGLILFNANPALLILTCLVKATAAGFIPALIYKVLSAKSNVAVIIPAILAPVLNTLIFCICMFLFFGDTLREWAGGTNVMLYTVTGLVGVNFLIELFINIILCPILGKAAIKASER